MTSGIEWDADLYARHTAHHRAYDDQVLGPLDIAPDWRILDLGSGAGDFSARLAHLVPDGAVLGIDRSDALVRRAANDHDEPNLAFAAHTAQAVGRLGSVALPDGGAIGPPFDLVISTATLHWVPHVDHRAVYSGVRQVLRPGGRFRAEFGGAGQMEDTLAVLNEESLSVGGPETPWYFAPVDTVVDDLVAAGFSLEGGFVRLVRQRRSVPDLAALRGWLDSQVLIAYRPALAAPDFDVFCERVLARLETEGRREDGSYDQNYVRLDLLAQAPGAGDTSIPAARHGR